MTHAVVLRIKLDRATSAGIAYLTDALGECARDLEAHEADAADPRLGLVADPEDEGRFSWEIAAESYT